MRENARIRGANKFFTDEFTLQMVRASEKMLGIVDGSAELCGQAPAVPFATQQGSVERWYSHYENALGLDSFEFITEKTRFRLGELAKRAQDPSKSLSKLELDEFFRLRFYRYLALYTKAYFRDGHFVKVTLDATALRDKLLAEVRKLTEKPLLAFEDLKDKVGDEHLTSAIKAILTEDDAATIKKILDFARGTGEIWDMDPVLTWGDVRDSGFVTRDGRKYQFPALDVSFKIGSDERPELPSVDIYAVGSDLVRVFLEAFFDALFGVPGVAEGTAVHNGRIKMPVEPSPIPLFVDGAQGVSQLQFGEIKTRANTIEGGVHASVSRVIRGISWLSLNNEPLADLIATIFSVSTRKIAEKALWCWHSCVDPSKESSEGNPELIATRADGITITLDLRFMGYTGLR